MVRKKNVSLFAEVVFAFQKAAFMTQNFVIPIRKSFYTGLFVHLVFKINKHTIRTQKPTVCINPPSPSS